MKPDVRKALEAVLLFYAAGPWGQDRVAKWRELTGSDDANTKVLCDTIRRVLAEEAPQ